MKALIFDLDGTLIDSAPDIQAVANGVLRGQGVEPLSLTETRSFIGGGAGIFVERMSKARDLPVADQARLLSQFLAGYEDAHDLTTVYPGVRAALDGWVAAGVPMGLCTNKPFGPTMRVLLHLDLKRYFSVIVGGDSLPTRKPDPAMLIEVMTRMDVKDVLYLGDSEVDAETARAADVPFALFTQGYRKTPVADLPHAMAFDDWTRFAADLTV